MWGKKGRGMTIIIIIIIIALFHKIQMAITILHKTTIKITQKSLGYLHKAGCEKFVKVAH